MVYPRPQEPRVGWRRQSCTLPRSVPAAHTAYLRAGKTARPGLPGPRALPVLPSCPHPQIGSYGGPTHGVTGKREHIGYEMPWVVSGPLFPREAPGWYPFTPASPLHLAPVSRVQRILSLHTWWPGPPEAAGALDQTSLTIASPPQGRGLGGFLGCKSSRQGSESFPRRAWQVGARVLASVSPALGLPIGAIC